MESKEQSLSHICSAGLWNEGWPETQNFGPVFILEDSEGRTTQREKEHIKILA